MGETLLIVAVILAVGWLIDRVGIPRGKFSGKTIAPSPTKPQDRSEKKPHSSQTLRKDWLRLGRRS